MITESLVRVSQSESGQAAEPGPEIDLFLTATEKPGTADTPLLVIHGGPDWDHSYLRDPLMDLADTHRVLLPDLRGCGRSTQGLPTPAYTWDAAVADLIGLLDALAIDTTHVLGFSTGGAIAQRLTLAAPERVRSLIVASSSVLPVPDDALGEDLEAELAARMERGEKLAVEQQPTDTPTTTPTYAEMNRFNAIRSAPANVWRQEVLSDYVDRLKEVRFTGDWSAGWESNTLGPSRPENSAHRLAALDVPMLLLHGRQDLTFPATLTQEAAKVIPRAQVVILEDAGHMAHIDQPEAWLAALREFLASVG